MSATSAQIRHRCEAAADARKVRGNDGSGRLVRAAILYDHLESMLAANELLGRLRPDPEVNEDWTVNSWSFEMLETGLEGWRALEDTSDVRVMVLALGDAQSLEKWPASWLWRWAANRRAGMCGFWLVLFGPASVALRAAETATRLHRFAEDQGLTMFVFRLPGGCEQPAPEPNGNSVGLAT
jgi:hypothetical protein